MHHPTDRIIHTTAFITPVVEHWLEPEIAQWVHPMKDRSDNPSYHEEMLLPRSYRGIDTDSYFVLFNDTLNTFLINGYIGVRNILSGYLTGIDLRSTACQTGAYTTSLSRRPRQIEKERINKNKNISIPFFSQFIIFSPECCCNTLNFLRDMFIYCSYLLCKFCH